MTRGVDMGMENAYHLTMQHGHHTNRSNAMGYFEIITNPDGTITLVDHRVDETVECVSAAEAHQYVAQFFHQTQDAIRVLHNMGDHGAADDLRATTDALRRSLLDMRRLAAEAVA